jgi:hypothetical protein
VARNAEKAKSMLNRFWAQKNGTDQPVKRRPRFVVRRTPTHTLPLAHLLVQAKVSSLKECEEWRLDVIKEISKQITAIQVTHGNGIVHCIL